MKRINCRILLATRYSQLMALHRHCKSELLWALLIRPSRKGTIRFNPSFQI